MLVSGQMPVAGLFEWLQVLELNRRTVQVRLRRHGESGMLRLVRGRLAEARLGAITGDEAAGILLTWLDAHFEQQTSLDERPGGVRRSNYDLMLQAAGAAAGPADVDPTWRIAGDLAAMSVPELLQLADLNRRRVALRLPQGTRVVFDESRIVEAVAGEVSGPEAVFAALNLSVGTFDLAPVASVPAGAFVGTVNELLVEGTRRADEERLLRGEPVPDPDPTEGQLLAELAAGTLSQPIRLAMARRFQPRGEATPVPVLTRLAGDPDAAVRQAALDSIDRLPPAVRQALAADAETPPAIRRRVAAGLAQADVAPPPSGANPSHPGAAVPQPEDLPPDEPYPRNIHGRIRDLSMADKIFLARRGTRNERLVLMRHPNRNVALAALESSRTGENDVAIIARATSANADVLAAIAHDPRYNSRYAVARDLVMNPKTPSQEAVRLVARLRERDLREADRESDLAEPVRAAVRKRLRALEVKRRF